MGNGKWEMEYLLKNLQTPESHTMELKVTWSSMCLANNINLLNEISENRVHAIHLFYIILYAMHSVRMGSDLKEILVIKKLRGDDEQMKCC